MRYTTRLSVEEDAALRKAITAPLLAHNIAHVGPIDYQPLIVTLRDEAGIIHGGLWGHTAHAWLFVQYLAVAAQARGQGLGARLMADAESEAARRGCHSVWLDTFEFQARGFYQKQGYVQFGELKDYPPPFTRYFFRKSLGAEPGGS